MEGRDNTDITHKNNEILIRAEILSSPITNINPFPFKFNSLTQAFIQIKNDVILVLKTMS
jgi:hypothetical protein